MAARFTTIPSGTLRPTLSGTSYNAPFDMIADFTPSGSCTTCATGEYRQYVKGYFKLNGATVTHNLCGTTLSSSWQEDCGVFGGNTYKYGYHSIPFGNSRFTPNQADGCHFIGHDAPGFSNLVSGDRPEINLQFKGDLIDTGNGNNVLATSNWSVSGTSTVP